MPRDVQVKKKFKKIFWHGVFEIFEMVHIDSCCEIYIQDHPVVVVKLMNICNHSSLRQLMSLVCASVVDKQNKSVR